MVLRGDKAAGCPDLLHGLVVAAVSVFEFVDSGSRRLAEQLVAHADAHAGTHNRVRQEGAYIPHRRLAGVGVAGSVGKEKPVESERIEVVVPRHTDDLHAAADEATEDILLHAAVHQHDFLWRAFVVADNLLARHFVHEIDTLVLRHGDVVRCVVEEYLPHHHALLAQALGEFAGVDARDARHVLALEPVGKALHGIPVGEIGAVVADDDGGGMDFLALHIVRQAVLTDGERRDTVVAHQREGQHHQLPRVGGVGQALGVAHHRRIENHLARHGLLVAEGCSVKLGTV